VLNEDHLAPYAPRYPGLVREARKRLGDPVARGDVLAVIESNESLQSYEIRSSIAGTVVAKDAAPGEFASESRVIYTVTDLSTVWADLYVSYDDFRLLRAGQIATVETREGKIRAEGALLHLSAVGTETTQKLLARVEVPNPGGEWRPGLFVTGKIAVGEENVPVAVKATALQKFRDWDVVFLNDGATFQAVPLELGRRDAEWVEVLSGLEPGQRYAAEGSFIVKADVGKSGATHDH
jgi:cobalt-zinc-cadmium efflux system membrane fusion protein